MLKPTPSGRPTMITANLSKSGYCISQNGCIIIVFCNQIRSVFVLLWLSDLLSVVRWVWVWGIGSTVCVLWQIFLIYVFDLFQPLAFCLNVCCFIITAKHLDRFLWFLHECSLFQAWNIVHIFCGLNFHPLKKYKLWLHHFSMCR